MKISKHVHSCLFIEEQGKTVLIDPGIFTYQEKALDLAHIDKLDYLLFTHEHPDHMYLPFVKEIVAKFPEVKIVTNQSIVELLQKETIKATTQSPQSIIMTSINHERVFDKEIIENGIFHIFDRLTHPGDSMSFISTKDILALPLLGPSWMITQAAEKAVALQPKTVIPIHDYNWKDMFRKEYYHRLFEFFKKKGIDFKSLETGQKIEV
jgi:L-ascorbate metabolism protein UlaG (beta-lactamase superfamily)